MRRVSKVMTPEEADLLDREQNLARTPDERVQALEELRTAFIPSGDRRIARTCEFAEVPPPSRP